MSKESKPPHSNPFKSSKARQTAGRDVLSKGATLPIPFNKTTNMLQDTIEDVAKDTVFREPIWTFSGLKLENFCKNLLRRNKNNKITKSSSVENINCLTLNGCLKDDDWSTTKFNTVGRSQKKLKQKEGSEKQKSEKEDAMASSLGSKKFLNIFKSRSKSRENIKKQPETEVPTHRHKSHDSNSNVRQPFRAIPNEIQKLDKEPKRRSGKASTPAHSFLWTQQPHDQERIKDAYKSDMSQSPNKPFKSKPDVVANRKGKENPTNPSNGVSHFRNTERGSIANLGTPSREVSMQQVKRTFGKNPIIIRKTISTTETTTAIIPRNNNDSEINQKIDKVFVRPSRLTTTHLSVPPLFSKEDYKEIKKKARSVEMTLPRRHRDSSSDLHELEGSESAKRRACSVVRKTNLCTITTKVEESYHSKETVNTGQTKNKKTLYEQSNIEQRFTETYKQQQTSFSIHSYDNQHEYNARKKSSEGTISNSSIETSPRRFNTDHFSNEDGAYVGSVLPFTPIAGTTASTDSNSTVVALDTNPSTLPINQSPLTSDVRETSPKLREKVPTAPYTNGPSNDCNHKTYPPRQPNELTAFADKLVKGIFENVTNQKDALSVSNAVEHPSNIVATVHNEQQPMPNDVFLEQTCALSYFDGLKWVPIQTSEEIHTRDGLVKRTIQLKEFSADLPGSDLLPNGYSALNTDSIDGEYPSVNSIEGYIFNDDEQKPTSPTSSSTLVPPSPSSSPTLVPSPSHPTSPQPTTQPLSQSFETPPTTSLPSPLPGYSPTHTKTTFKRTLFSPDPQPSTTTIPCIKQITTHDYGEMYSIFHEIPQPILWLKARILTQYNTKDLFYHHLLTNCSELRPGAWRWGNAPTIGPGHLHKGSSGGRDGSVGGCSSGREMRVCVETCVSEVSCEVPIEKFTLLEAS